MKRDQTLRESETTLGLIPFLINRKVIIVLS
ncbi:hypothetical protein predicted by Glimmer/Critica [Limosilactobacillus fermentum]|nr:hypothetical protein predicted by Glimmer/Critica [Limosilactobacillus fermentum]